MTFETFFRLISYAAVLCGFLALWISGTFGVLVTVLFLGVMVAAWFLEDSRWQISERVGTVLIVLALPVFYLGWRYRVIDLYGAETAVAGILARMILSLSAIKLLQRKSDRDWIFLYLMAFFEVLLAAGLSISGLYVVTFLAFLLVMVCAVIAFETRKTSRLVDAAMTLGGKLPKTGDEKLRSPISIRRLPSAAIVLIVFIVLLAVPLFFMLPRVGGAGFGGSQSGLSTSTGFSDSVKLGGIGRIQQTDEVAMRVRVEGPSAKDGLYMRGVALDTFDNQSWSKSRVNPKEPYVKGDRELIQIEPISNRDSLIIQTVYLEPMDSPVLFAMPKIIAVQGGFPIIEKDPYGAISYRRSFERISYKVLSDRNLPDASRLRDDNVAYGSEMQNYLQLPQRYDKRIFELAYSITSQEKGRYDRAVAVERYLQNNFGYTLEQKAGGNEPLADFLFNVREGHCEYFATAMAVMLRTQGIATRIVNGFHGGEYNDASDMTVIRQRNAHSWVEVYFPKENVWVPFDPTPFSGEAGTMTGGLTAQVGKYIEALEAFWIQYFVAFDNQEQRSLARTLKNGFVDYSQDLSSYFTQIQAALAAWWADLRGENGGRASLWAVVYALGYIAGTIIGILLFAWLIRKVVKLKVWGRLRNRVLERTSPSVVEFYERMLRTLERRGVVRQPFQTPLEFAYSVGSPVVEITEKYNRVRFGERALSENERSEIEAWLKKLSSNDENR